MSPNTVSRVRPACSSVVGVGGPSAHSSIAIGTAGVAAAEDSSACNGLLASGFFSSFSSGASHRDPGASTLESMNGRLLLRETQHEATVMPCTPGHRILRRPIRYRRVKQRCNVSDRPVDRLDALIAVAGS